MARRPSEVLQEHRSEVRDVFARHGLAKPQVFGSVAAGTDTEVSDLDVLFEPGPHTTLFDLSRARAELTRLLRVEVDLVSVRQVPESTRMKILENAVPL